MRTDRELLIFVEDPAAATYVAGLPAELAGAGCRTGVFADGKARPYLRQRGVPLAAMPSPATAATLLAEVAPSLVLVGTADNPDTLGLKLVAAARVAGIESVGVVDAPCNSEYRFRGRTDDPLAYAPDWLLVPDQWTRETYIALGFEPQRVMACGHPHYDYLLAVAVRLAEEDPNTLRRRMLPQAPADRAVVVFAAEVSAGLNARPYQRSPEYTFTGRGISTGRTEIVLEEFLDALGPAPSRPYLVLRLHPKNTAQDFAPYLPEFDLVSTGGSPLELIHAADLVVGITSMLLLEATVMGTPALAIVPRSVERDWLAAIRMGLTRCVTNRSQLRTALGALLREGCRQESRVGEAVGTGSLQRVIEFVVGRLERDDATGTD